MINEGIKLGSKELIKKGETLLQVDHEQCIYMIHRSVVSTRAVDNIKYIDKFIVKDPNLSTSKNSNYESKNKFPNKGMCQFSVINPLVKSKAHECRNFMELQNYCSRFHL